jgi:hypothetical protein
VVQAQPVWHSPCSPCRGSGRIVEVNGVPMNRLLVVDRAEKPPRI